MSTWIHCDHEDCQYWDTMEQPPAPSYVHLDDDVHHCPRHDTCGLCGHQRHEHEYGPCSHGRVYELVAAEEGETGAVQYAWRVPIDGPPPGHGWKREVETTPACGCETFDAA